MKFYLKIVFCFCTNLTLFTINVKLKGTTKLALLSLCTVFYWRTKMSKILENACLRGIYKNYVSLGHCCHVASDLETLGLRNCSLPFDWIISEWETVENILSKKTTTFINPENLYQHISVRNRYKSEIDGVILIHDFSPYKSFKSQINSVSKKYQRRLDRFFSAICEPTLFIRFCSDKKEFEYLLDNSIDISLLLKRFNENNRLVVISDFITSKNFNTDYLDVFYIEKATDIKELHPIISCKELSNILSSAKFDTKIRNLNFTENKISTQNAKKSLLYRLQRKLQKFYKKYFEKEYIHPKTYR